MSNDINRLKLLAEQEKKIKNRKPVPDRPVFNRREPVVGSKAWRKKQRRLLIERNRNNEATNGVTEHTQIDVGTPVPPDLMRRWPFLRMNCCCGWMGELPERDPTAPEPPEE